MPNVPLTFKFKGLIAASAVMGAMDLFFASVTWFAVRDPDFSIGLVLFSLLMCVVLCLISFIVINGRADLVIDSGGISRCLFGKEWQRILWSDVQVIKVFPVFDGTPSRGFNIIPSPSSKFRFMPAGKISFLDQAENMDELIDALNCRVALHRIQVEIKHHDRIVTSTHIERSRRSNR